MAPYKKVFLDKIAWAWCDSVDISNISDDHIRTAYRLNVSRCKPSACRRNCKANPYCLSALGEARWLLPSNPESEEDDIAAFEIRKLDTFVGLKNLGATCYVNSLLQLWFHHPEFREAVFLWDQREDPTESLLSVLKNGDTKVPRCVVGHLQYLFMLMQFGKSKTLDPTDFIQALDLEPSMQQDAQEFSKLFISLLEESLNHQSNPKVKNFITNNFRGEYSYITRCSRCLKESVSPSMFYELELNVKGNKSLRDSIQEFLREERIEGVNAYSCGECQKKQEAIRFIRLEKLPPILNLQLMRFIYDRQRGQKKKLNSYIQFPESLDMSEYIEGINKECCLYKLSAVLIHKGPSAYSGHYIAHICDRATGTWYKFNDEVVEKMEGKNLKLNAGEEEEKLQKTKRPRLAKGFLTSNNAYMLVYTLATSQVHIRNFTEEELPDHLKSDLKKHNMEYDTMISESKKQQVMLKVNGQAQKEEMSTLWKILPVQEGMDDWEALSTSWLVHWLSNAKGVVKPIDNGKMLCPHNKLNPTSSKDFKYINPCAGVTLYEKYCGGPKLMGQKALCKECVTFKAKEIQIRNKIADDFKGITNLLKHPLPDCVPAFWVGKNSLKIWRKKAAKIYLTKEDQPGATNGNNDDESDNEAQVNGDLGTWVTKEHSGYSITKEEADLTEHIKEVNGDVLSGLETKGYFKEHESGEGSTSDSSRLMFNGHLNSRNPTSLSHDSPKGTKRKLDGVRMDSEDTGYEVKADEEGEEGTLDQEFNQEIVCPHGTLSVQSSSRRLVSEEIWNKLKSYFSTCKEFSKEVEPCSTCLSLASESEVTKDLYKQQAQSQRELLSSLTTNRGRPKFVSGTFHVVSIHEFLNPWRKFIKENGRVQPPYSLRCSMLMCVHGFLLLDPYNPDDAAKLAVLTDDEWSLLSSLYATDVEVTFTYGSQGEIVDTSPKMCEECQAARMEREHQARLQYDKATIYVRQIAAPQHSLSPGHDDSDMPSTLEVKSTLVGGDTFAVTNHQGTLETIRRSKRHRKVRGERRVIVSSTDTLRDLKLKVLQTFGVAPFDQHLVRDDGTELTFHEATLSSLNILPNSVLHLKVDEPIDEDSSAPVDYCHSSQPEEGFKGTLLLKR